MTVLDKSVPFIRVLMVMPRKTVRKEIPLNTKYQYVEFDDTLKEAWCKLQLEVGLFDSLAQAKEKWESMLKEDRTFFVQNFYLWQINRESWWLLPDYGQVMTLKKNVYELILLP